MSGAFEVAAGSFAVVGVVDVLIRTGREIYAFISDVAEAPKQLTDLNGEVNDTLLLLQASVKCLSELKAENPHAAPEVAQSLQASTRALERGLRDLKSAILRFKGKKTWSNVKFVLNEKKITQAIQKLERAKVLLTATLTLASSQMSSCSQKQVKALVEKTAEQARVRSNLLSAKVDAASDSIISKLEQIDLDTQDVHSKQHEKLVTTLNSYRRSVSSRHHDLQRQANTHQRITTKHMKNINRRAALVDKGILNSSQMSSMRHDQTQEMISTLLARVEQLNVYPRQGIRGPRCALRDIRFSGERPDMVMAYLLSLQDGLDEALKSLRVSHGQEIAPTDIEWLEYEFRHLVDSAAQERAAQHQFSYAESFDQWTYSNTTVPTNTRMKKEVASVMEEDDRIIEKSRVSSALKPKRARWACNKTWCLTTTSGDFRIRLPWRTSRTGEERTVMETGFTCTITQNNTTYIIDAQFIRSVNSLASPRLYTHLHAYTFVDSDIWGTYHSLMCDGSLQEIDAALRDGTISLYHRDIYEDQLFTWFVGRYGRGDLLSYYENEGLDFSSTVSSSSFLDGYTERACAEHTKATGKSAKEAYFNKTIAETDDPIALLPTFITMIVIQPGLGLSFDELTKLLAIFWRNLQEEGFPIKSLDSVVHEFYCTNCEAFHIGEDLVSILKDIKEWAPSLLETILWNIMENLSEMFLYIEAQNRTICAFWVENIFRVLSVFVEMRVHFHVPGGLRGTASMFARKDKTLWAIWCEALHGNGVMIEELLQEEDNSWLLSANWLWHWKQLYPDTYNFMALWELEKDEQAPDTDTVPLDSDWEDDSDDSDMDNRIDMRSEDELVDQVPGSKGTGLSTEHRDQSAANSLAAIWNGRQRSDTSRSLGGRRASI